MKNNFNLALINLTAQHIQTHYAQFNTEHFIHTASQNLEQLSLKQRADQIEQALTDCLPVDFIQAAKILDSTLRPLPDTNQYHPINIEGFGSNEQGLAGWIIWPLAQYIARHGQAEHQQSMLSLKAMTKRFSSEFAIRPFLDQQPQKTLEALSHWLNDPCHHVRRLISEGTRPRLPWGMQLTQFITDPNAILPLLDALKDDSSEYVRRSVANNLNDISKDHPKRVIQICQTWLPAADKNRRRLIKHACRTLIKQGIPEALALFGYHAPHSLSSQLSLANNQINLGQSLHLTLSLHNQSTQVQNCLIDFVIYHQKANGQLTPKVFKWKELKLNVDQQLSLDKKHQIKAISTRKYYSGLHQIKIQINGHIVAEQDFTLTL